MRRVRVCWLILVLTDAWTAGLLVGWTLIEMGVLVNECVDGWVGGWVNGWMNELVGLD